MKHTLLTLALAFATTSAFANGFNPWDNRAVRDDQAGQPANVEVSSFYSNRLPIQDSRWQDEPQVVITITPYYLQNS
jgi:hypothetical protein